MGGSAQSAGQSSGDWQRGQDDRVKLGQRDVREGWHQIKAQQQHERHTATKPLAGDEVQRNAARCKQELLKEQQRDGVR